MFRNKVNKDRCTKSTTDQLKDPWPQPPPGHCCRGCLAINVLALCASTFSKKGIEDTRAPNPSAPRRKTPSKCCWLHKRKQWTNFAGLDSSASREWALASISGRVRWNARDNSLEMVPPMLLAVCTPCNNLPYAIVRHGLDINNNKKHGVNVCVETDLERTTDPSKSWSCIWE